MRSTKKKNKKRIPRNPHVVDAQFRKAGKHIDKRKERSRKACRKGDW